MKSIHELSSLKWTLSGWTPHLWRLMQTAEIGALPSAEIAGISAPVPGSVQRALREAGKLPDWNQAEKARECEWVENRHWIYECRLPDEWLPPNPLKGEQTRIILNCLGLDYSGWVFLNNKLVGDFRGTHIPHHFDLAAHVKPQDNHLQIVFDLPPRWLGQFGFTSQVREWKTRFNYTWDWQPRLVQIGIWDSISLEVIDGPRIEALHCIPGVERTNGAGTLKLRGAIEGPLTPNSGGTGDSTSVRVALADSRGETVREVEMSAEEFNRRGFDWNGLHVEQWWPNGHGRQPLYTLTVTLKDRSGARHDSLTRRVGFRRIDWEACSGAPKRADPWLCKVNGKAIFLQGVNFPPLLPNFADTPAETYRQRLTLYRDLGVNTLRVNGVGFLEKEIFYDLCDELGLLVWQDVPLSSSGVDNIPPTDAESIRQVGDILRSFIGRRQHHPSLLLWCGGNELHAKHDGYGVPMTTAHPLIRRLSEVALKHDPGRRFIPTTATGPRFNADAKDFGKGLHWNTHGPWKLWSDMKAWREYWKADDSLFRAESGAPGASPVGIIVEYAGGLNPMPVSDRNPVWRRPLTWWIEDGAFAAENGRPPESVEEYVTWSQKRQADALVIAVKACKDRFPRCGGILLWCGHDCYPCAANTSIIDFHGNPKPAALALKELWRA